MKSKKTYSSVEIALIILLLIISASLFWRHTRQPYSEPDTTVLSLIRSASAADLSGFKSASMPPYYAAFVRYFGERRFQQVTYIYQRVYQLALPKWWEYRRRAEALADVEYQHLHERVSMLGRDAFTRLSPDDRLELMDNPGKQNEFIYESGIKSLSGIDRARIDSIEDFRSGRDRNRFAEREAWNFLSAEDKAALVSSATLFSNDTPEKLLFLDRVGIPLLDKRTGMEIEGIPRSELNDPETFRYKYGEPIAKEFLARSKIPSNGEMNRCSFLREDIEGSLLRGDLARCVMSLQTPKGPVKLTVNLQKVEFRWLVSNVSPNFNQVNW